MAPKENEEEQDKGAAAGANGAGDNADSGNISPEAQKIIDELKGRLDLESSARVEAERRAGQSAQVAVVAQNEAEDANFQVVATAIETVTATQTALKARYRDALASQDYEAAAEIQGEMSTNAAQLVQLKNGKAAMEQEREDAKTRRPTNGTGAHVDKVEELARTLTPKSAAWVRAHPDFVNDVTKNRRMIRAHEDAIDEGHAPDSDGYFKFVEAKLKITPASVGDADAGAGGEALSGAAGGKGRGEGTGRGAAPPALPPNRGGGGNARRLTQEQKEIAKQCGMTEEEYATSLDALKADGRIH